MIQAIFRAISFGVTDARLYLPYILLLPDLKNNLMTNEFNKQLELVPEWMFISNISQILSNFDFSNECFLDNLIYKLAQKYPNALYYPFKLTRDNHKRMNDAKEKLHVSTISELLSKNETLNEFTAALECLVIPEKMFETHLHFFQEKLVSNMTDDAFRNAAIEMYQQMFVKNASYKGPEYSKFKHLHQQVQQLTTISWTNRKLEAKKFINSIKELVENSSVEMKRLRGQKIDIGRFCRWFEDFKWSGDSEFIEIPGQYGDLKPFIENHIKIVRFDQRLKVFSSKQSPIELKIIGSDGKTYCFVIKHGEDLRQDQRIQQVLKMMSKKLRLDEFCSKKHLRIETYEVIPVNSYCGMLQMINNAQTISEFMEEASKTLLSQTFNELNMRIKRDFMDFLLNNEKPMSWQKTYELTILKRSREALVQKFQQFEQVIPQDLISRALKNLSKSLESYYVLRKNFTTSLAVMNTAHWLLGIGDRHLSNIMMNMEKGLLIGIDFGLAFGAAATIEVPELIPFRLTSHFVNVFEPLGINGILKKNMMHALRCFKDHRETILICLEVFVKEPTLDWLLKSKNNTSIWNPEQRIDIVAQKMNGANPMLTLIEEMSNGDVSNNEQLFQAYKIMIHGSKECLRSRVPTKNLTIDEQISCLVELATDPSILSTTYVGWNSWF